MNNHQRSAYKGSAADSLAQFPYSAFILVCPQGTSQNKRGKLMYGFFEASQRKPQRLGLNVCFFFQLEDAFRCDSSAALVGQLLKLSQ